MASVVSLPFALPAAPAGHKASTSGSLSKPSTSTLLPAGPSYIAHSRRQLRQLDFDADDEEERKRAEASKTVDPNEIPDDIGDEPESAELLRSDPKEWKSQDHYAVLGLSAFRYKATPDQIKLAHRKKVLKHHPDKKAGATGLTNDDAFFKCIAKAYDVLSNPERRRHFDSVDEGVNDDAVPTGKEPEAKFFELWAPVFERESRFSEAKNGPVPALGDASSSKDDVNAFYDFWYNFDSWRSFEYLDKDTSEGDENRDNKRYQEKKNRAERARRKKEDNARLRSVVDRALAADPRIKAFKAAEKAAREAKKNKGRPGAPGAGAKQGPSEEEKKKAAEEEKRKAEEAAKKEEEDKAARADAKKAREAAKKNLKKHKKVIRDLITSSNYFQPSGSAPSASVIEAQLNGLDAITAALAEEPEKVAALRQEAEKAGSPDAIKAALAKAAADKGVAEGVFA